MELSLIIKFFLKFIAIYFEQKKKAEVKQEKFDLSEKQLITITSMAIHKIRTTAQTESVNADKAEDWIEVQLNERMFDHKIQATTEAARPLEKSLHATQTDHDPQLKSETDQAIAKRSNNQN